MDARVIERPFGSFERMLALRYLGAKREHGGLALISIVSVIGITLGVWALILTMSIMNGFRLELISKIIGFEPHVLIDTRGLPTEQIDAMMEDLRTRPGVVSVSPTSEGMALASAYGRSDGIQVRGIRPDDLRANELVAHSITDAMEQRMLAMTNPEALSGRYPQADGSLETFGADGAMSDNIVIGAAFASALGVGVGDRIKLTQSNGPRTVMGQSPGSSREFIVSAIFHVGNERYDRYAAFLPLDAAKALFRYDEGYQNVSIRLANPDADAAEAFANKLTSEGLPYAESWKRRNGTYVTALIVERNVMRLILFIVVIITSLNIITGVLMLVKNKARDIAILRTIGATRSGVVRIFMMTGTILGMSGVAIGVGLGVLFAIFIAPIQHFLEGLLGVQLFPADIYMLDSLPAQLQWSEVAWVGGAAFVVTLIMSIIPSMWAARLNPVEALRFE